jgi:lactate dehydrogenase-like 2-hydroxyacid dehydrogenase
LKPKVLVTREVFDEVLAYLSEHCDVEANQSDRPFDPATLATKLRGKAGVVCCLTDRIDAALLAACPDLKAVCNIAVGYNNIDVAACKARGVVATNTPGVLDDATADLAWALILGAARRITEAEAYLRNGDWKGWHLKQLLGVDVCGATLGIIGMGRVGQAIALRARGFDMPVLYNKRRRMPADVERWLNAGYAGKDELLAKSDFVVLQVPYSAETHHMIGEKELRMMKRSAILVNSARGGVVDDAALVRALKEGWIRGAGLDVFEDEPAINPGFLDLKNVVLVPHIGSSTHATRLAMAMTAARNCVAAVAGGTPPNPIV